MTGAAVLVLVTFVAYAPCLTGGFVLDDNVLVADSPLVKDPAGVYRIWFTADAVDYWPITYTSFWLEWRLWGMNPTGYHVTNLVLHLVGALLIWSILGKLSIPGAFLAALLFAVHPVNVESVAWIAQRKNLLALVFFLLSIGYYINAEKQSFGKVGRWYWLSLTAFVLAMLSKASVAILPFVLLGVVAWLRPLTRRDLVRVVPFFLVTAALIPVNVWFQSRFANPAVPATDLVDRALRAAAVTWFYLYKAVLPVHLTLQLEPEHRDVRYNLGLAFYQSQRLEDAMAQFRRVQRIDPDYSAAYNALGVALSDAGRSDEAIEQFELALRVNPDDPAAAANLEEVSVKKREAADDSPPGL